MVADTYAKIVQGGSGGTASGGDFNVTGSPGRPGFRLDYQNGIAGQGAPSAILNGGGNGFAGNTAGQNGYARGDGGGGGVVSDNATGRAGGLVPPAWSGSGNSHEDKTMTDTTTRLGLPLIAAAQAQKHVTHNQALALLDVFAGILPALSRSLTAPAGGESDGALYVLAGAGTGDWAGFAANSIAFMLDGGWRTITPTTGMVASLASESGKIVYWSGTAWAEVNPAAGSGTFTGLLTVNGQIKFPATQNASSDPNTLDDYEEGTFTPGVLFGGLAVGVSYSTQYGYYTRIGNVVHVEGYFRLSARGSSSGYATATGLPFAPAHNYAGILCPYYKDMAAGIASLMTLTTSGGGFYIEKGAAGAATPTSDADYTNTTAIGFAGSYHI